MKLNLVVLSPGTTKGKSISVTKFPFTIGRDQKCQLRPSNVLVSGRHCALEQKDGKFYIKDLGSTNGTTLNAKPVSQEVLELKHLDQLQIGPLAFEIRIEGAPAVDQRTPLPPTKPAETNPDDETIAAVLLSIQDEGSPVLPGLEVDNTGVPTGGTAIMDPSATVVDMSMADAGTEGGKKKEEKTKAVKKESENTSAVAEQLLNKYLRRPRKV